MKLKKKLTSLLISLSFVFALSLPALVGAAGDYGMGQTLGATGYKETLTKNSDVATIIGNIIGYLLSFVGLIFLIMIIYGGFEWMTAGGDEAKVKKAISLFTQAVFGLLIISAAYLLTRFIGEILLNGTAMGK